VARQLWIQSNAEPFQAAFADAVNATAFFRTESCTLSGASAEDSAKLASLSFDAAGFGHGKPIARDASTRFRNKYASHLEDQLRSAA
jgi:hypothetical protein